MSRDPQAEFDAMMDRSEVVESTPDDDPFIVIWKGKRRRLNGRTSWKQRSHAKAAIAMMMHKIRRGMTIDLRAERTEWIAKSGVEIIRLSAWLRRRSP